MDEGSGELPEDPGIAKTVDDVFRGVLGRGDDSWHVKASGLREAVGFLGCTAQIRLECLDQGIAHARGERPVRLRLSCRGAGRIAFFPRSAIPAAMPPKAVILLSGGMDSATALAIAKADGFDPIALTVDYGQRHRRELEAASRVAKHFLVKDHRIVTLDLTAIGGSALTDRRIPVPEQRRLEEIGQGIPATYVPARNSLFLSAALGLAEAVGANAIYIAASALDYSGYPDCRPEFYRAFQEVARLGTKRGVEGDVIEIRTPLIAMSKADIVRKGQELGVPWELTWSCYQGGAKACGVCDACQLRLRGFREAGVRDPLPYARRRAPPAA